jgi:hypothetical protein
MLIWIRYLTLEDIFALVKNRDNSHTKIRFSMPGCRLQDRVYHTASEPRTGRLSLLTRALIDTCLRLLPKLTTAQARLNNHSPSPSYLYNVHMEFENICVSDYSRLE